MAAGMVGVNSPAAIGRLKVGVELDLTGATVIGGTFSGETLTNPTINGTVSTTGLTMPAFTANGNISIGTNKIRTSSFEIQETSALGTTPVVLKATTGNVDGRFVVAPNGTSTTSWVRFATNSTITADQAYLYILGDATAHRIQSAALGVGSLAPIIIRMGNNDIITIGTGNTLDFHNRAISNADFATGDIDLATGARLDFTDTQSTVGAAGGASALPVTPSGYVNVKVGGAAFVIPYYAAA